MRAAAAAAAVVDAVVEPAVFVGGGGKPGRNELEFAFANVDADRASRSLSLSLCRDLSMLKRSRSWRLRPSEGVLLLHPLVPVLAALGLPIVAAVSFNASAMRA